MYRVGIKRSVGLAVSFYKHYNNKKSPQKRASLFLLKRGG